MKRIIKIARHARCEACGTPLIAAEDACPTCARGSSKTSHRLATLALAAVVGGASYSCGSSPEPVYGGPPEEDTGGVITDVYGGPPMEDTSDIDTDADDTAETDTGQETIPTPVYGGPPEDTGTPED